MAKRRKVNRRKRTKGSLPAPDAVPPPPVDSGSGRVIPKPSAPGFWNNLIALVLKLKTGLQLTGFIILIAGFVAYRTIEVDRVPGAIAAGSIGLFLMAFGLVLHLSSTIRVLQKPYFLLCVLLLLGVFVIILFNLSLRHLSAMSKSQKEEYASLVRFQHESNERAIDTIIDVAERKSKTKDKASALRQDREQLSARFEVLLRAIDSGNLIAAASARKEYNVVAERLNRSISAIYVLIGREIDHAIAIASISSAGLMSILIDEKHRIMSNARLLTPLHPIGRD